jgi:transposase InsO family protein
VAILPRSDFHKLSRAEGPKGQTWRTFLTNHLAQTAAIDFFTVPTATFRVLFVFVVLSHERRRVVHFGVTEHPTQEWTMQQMREAFPWDQAPRFVLRDRDAIYGRDFAAMTRDMGMEEVLTAPRSPWQNPFVERLVGSIRRECLDHVIVWNDNQPSHPLCHAGYGPDAIPRYLEHRMRVLVARQEITGADRQWAAQYEPGNVVRYAKGSKALGIAPGEYVRVEGVDEKQNYVTVERENGQRLSYDPRRLQGVAL